MELTERLSLFQEMVLCCHNIYLWKYDAAMQLLSSNCPEADALDALFSMGDTKKVLQDYAKIHEKPVVMTTDTGNMLVAVPHHENSLTSVYILGPFAVDDVSRSAIEAHLRKTSLPLATRNTISTFLRSLPIVPLTRIYEYALMLTYCITEKSINISDLHYRESAKDPIKVVPEKRTADVHGTYQMEREMTRMVREGDLSFQSHMHKLALTGNLGKLSNGDASRQMKNAVLVCIVLFSRAAIEGGLSPEVAMTLTDHYFQSVESARSFQELQDITLTMQNDFVERVHRIRSSQLSKPIQQVVDYIQLHAEDDISLRLIAESLNYSEYYLSHKFKEEMQETFRDYVRRQKLEKSKAYLVGGNLSIREISERMHFCSASYYTESFRQTFGMTPTEWRNAR